MASNQLHHTGLLVADMDRAVEFYIEALGGHYLHKPAVNAGPSARFVMGGDSDEVAFAFCYIGFEQGAVELMQFVKDPPDWASTPFRGKLPHFGLRVDDVPATVELVLAHGGEALWPQPMDWSGKTVMYVADPDGNPIELFDVGLQAIVDATIELYPDVAP